MRRPLQVGDFAITLPRINPDNAGRLVYLLDHATSRPDLGITDAFLVQVVDGGHFAEVTTYCPNGHREQCYQSRQCWAERRYLRPLDKLEEPVVVHAEEAIGERP